MPPVANKGQKMNVTSLNETHSSANSPVGPSGELMMELVVEELADGYWRLRSGLVASRALSCLVEPSCRDSVLVAKVGQESIIISIVSRPNDGILTLSSEQAQGLVVKATSIALTSENGVHVQAQDSIKLSAPFGSLRMISENLMQSVGGSLVTVAQAIVNKTKHFQINAEETIVSQAKVQSITAENDLFMDADRINMG